MKVNGDTITEVKSVRDTIYMSLAQENSRWYLDPEVGPIYTTVSLSKI